MRPRGWALTGHFSASEVRLTSPVAPAFVVLGESLGPAQLAGGALVVLAVHRRLRVAEMNAPAESGYSQYEKETS